MRCLALVDCQEELQLQHAKSFCRVMIQVHRHKGHNR